jgi:hypothetical protein
VILKDLFVNQLHLEELDEYQLTASKLDATDRIHFAGVPRLMSVIIALNLICKPFQSEGRTHDTTPPHHTSNNRS